MSLKLDANKEFPASLTGKWEYVDSNDLTKKLEEVAVYVSQVYAKLPNLPEEEREKLRKLEIWFEKVRSTKLPSQDKCQEFEDALKMRIIKEFTKDEEYISIQLETDNRAKGVLKEVALSVFKQAQGDLYCYFPYKACTTIGLDKKSKIIDLRMYFKSVVF